MRTALSHFFQLLDIMLAVLFGVWSVHVFKGITGKNRYRCYNEPNLTLAKYEYGFAFGVFGYGIIRLVLKIVQMFRERG